MSIFTESRRQFLREATSSPTMETTLASIRTIRRLMEAESETPDQQDIRLSYPFPHKQPARTSYYDDEGRTGTHVDPLEYRKMSDKELNQAHARVQQLIKKMEKEGPGGKRAYRHEHELSDYKKDLANIEHEKDRRKGVEKKPHHHNDHPFPKTVALTPNQIRSMEDDEIRDRIDQVPEQLQYVQKHIDKQKYELGRRGVKGFPKVKRPSTMSDYEAEREADRDTEYVLSDLEMYQDEYKDHEKVRANLQHELKRRGLQHKSKDPMRLGAYKHLGDYSF